MIDNRVNISATYRTGVEIKIQGQLQDRDINIIAWTEPGSANKRQHVSNACHPILYHIIAYMRENIKILITRMLSRHTTTTENAFSCRESLSNANQKHVV